MDPNEAAKRALIAYRQLSEIAKETLHFASGDAYVETYNRVLENLKQCFTLDKAFLESIGHLKPLARGANDLPYQMSCDSKILLATTHSFIEMYLSPEEKKKAIGFHTQG
jgi:hypothetical protein